MRTSLRKLRGFALPNKQDSCKERRIKDEILRPLPQLDELSKASQDMQDMRNCYDSLLSAAAATANSAFEFSESLREMGACLLEKTALNDDEESGKVLLMLGKIQYELQRLVDTYRSHLFQTITSPSESLLNQLVTVEEMKRQCDEKRDAYENMIMKQREKSKSRGSKGVALSSRQLQTARDEFDEEASLFIFRLKSLKRGQSRSLLTQAARHHAAQMNFFKKALRSLETVELQVKSVAEKQHIDYQFIEDEDDNMDAHCTDDEYSDSSDEYDDGELSFDYRINERSPDVAPSSTNSTEENAERITRNDFAFIGEIKTITQSAPLFAEQKSDPPERIRLMRPSSTRKLHTYALPTPDLTKSSTSKSSETTVPSTRQTSPTPDVTKSKVSKSSDTINLPSRQTSLRSRTRNLWHSSPLEPKLYDKLFRDEKFSRPNNRNAQPILQERNKNSPSSPLPLPSADLPSFRPFDPQTTSVTKRSKRQAFSGPLTSNRYSTKIVSATNSPLLPLEHPQLFSGPLLRNPVSQPPSSPKVSTNSSIFVSSPVITELHELPRPPTLSPNRSPLVDHSAPMVSISQEYSTTKKSVVLKAASSPLPMPHQTVSRSRSTHSGGSGDTVLRAPRTVETPYYTVMDEDTDSPPLSPISLSHKSS